MDSTEQMLKTLTETHAVSGFEEQMRKVMREYLTPLGEIANDKLRSVICFAGGKTYVSKAFDDRIGCAVMIDALRELKNGSHPNAVYGVATVMEEVSSLRGARTSVHVVNPDVAIILESGIAGDPPGITPEESAEKLGGGPVLGLYDALMIPNLKLRDLVYSTAEELKIPLQHFLIKAGATDGGAIHIHQAGVPT